MCFRLCKVGCLPSRLLAPSLGRGRFAVCPIETQWTSNPGQITRAVSRLNWIPGAVGVKSVSIYLDCSPLHRPTPLSVCLVIMQAHALSSPHPRTILPRLVCPREDGALATSRMSYEPQPSIFHPAGGRAEGWIIRHSLSRTHARTLPLFLSLSLSLSSAHTRFYVSLAFSHSLSHLSALFEGSCLSLSLSLSVSLCLSLSLSLVLSVSLYLSGVFLSPSMKPAKNPCVSVCFLFLFLPVGD